MGILNTPSAALTEETVRKAALKLAEMTLAKGAENEELRSILESLGMVDPRPVEEPVKLCNKGLHEMDEANTMPRYNSTGVVCRRCRNDGVNARRQAKRDTKK